MNIPIPAALNTAFARWEGTDRPAASAVKWNRSLWEKSISIPEALSGQSITRTDAIKVAGKVAISDEQSQYDAFVVAMIWGHGRTPYGPYRVRQILEQPGFAEQLDELTSRTLEEGGIQAYRLAYERRNAREPFLAHLGAAFGTKYLYFLTKAQSAYVSPILDAVAHQWFRTNAPDINVRVSSWWYPNRYEIYVDTLHDWGNQLGIAADDVEYMIFAHQQAVNTDGRWAEAWLSANTLSSSQLLQRLRSSLDADGLHEGAGPWLDSIQGLIEGSRSSLTASSLYSGL